MISILFAFKNGNQGDLFVQKSPSSTINDLAIAIKELFNSKNPVEIIGTRHGEKLYETLCTKEEMSKADNMESFYRIPADNRDLNYGKYFDKGNINLDIEDYNSHNTERLNIEQIKEKLLSIDYVKEKLKIKN